MSRPQQTLGISLAKGVPIETEIARRGIKLRGRGPDRCGPCPQCGGTDRFSINIVKGLWNCRGCGRGGDVIDLVMHLDGVGHRDAVRTLVGDEHRPVMPPVKPVHDTTADDAKQTSRTLALWHDASPIWGTLAQDYLRGRGLEPPPGDDVLRFHSRCPFGPGITYACMLALYRDIKTNEPKAIQRTALDPDGNKIGRLSLGPVGGGAIKLDADENVEQGLHIGEGLETCLATRQIGLRPCWSVGSAGGIRAFPVLSGIDAITILVDHDQADRNNRRAGQEAALECARRWHATGREVIRYTPKESGSDVADLLEAAP
jgi:hypothetical protein